MVETIARSGYEGKVGIQVDVAAGTVLREKTWIASLGYSLPGKRPKTI